MHFATPLKLKRNVRYVAQMYAANYGTSSFSSETKSQDKEYYLWDAGVGTREPMSHPVSVTADNVDQIWTKWRHNSRDGTRVNSALKSLLRHVLFRICNVDRHTSDECLKVGMVLHLIPEFFRSFYTEMQKD